MAIFNSYLLGKARKSVGNVTLAYVEKKNIARAKVFSRRDNATPPVLTQRAKMRLLGAMSRRLLPIIRVGFVGVGKGTTSNAFVAQNMGAVSVDESYAATMDYDRMRVASGILYPPAVTVTFDDAGGTFSFSQAAKEETDGYALADDQVYAVLYEMELNRAKLFSLVARGTGGMASVDLPDGWTGEKVKVYAFATSANGREASDSQVLTVG